MKIVKNWRHAYKWWSMRGAALLMALPPMWAILPPDLKAMIPESWQPWVVFAIGAGIAIGRLKDQGEDI